MLPTGFLVAISLASILVSGACVWVQFKRPPQSVRRLTLRRACPCANGTAKRVARLPPALTLWPEPALMRTDYLSAARAIVEVGRGRGLRHSARICR